MTTQELEQCFQTNEACYKERPKGSYPIKNKDVCAMIFLESKFPDKLTLCAEHDEISLCLDEKYLEQLTEEDVKELVRLTVNFNGDYLYIYV